MRHCILYPRDLLARPIQIVESALLDKTLTKFSIHITIQISINVLDGEQISKILDVTLPNLFV
jgi:hypothetical protein